MKILLYADSDPYKGRVGAPTPYVQFFSQFGEVVLVHSNNDLEQFIDLGDVLAVPGGADVDSKIYGQAPNFNNGRNNPHYEFLDRHLLAPFIETGKPVIGICRGAQAINSALGGTLYQHIIGHVQSKDRSETTEKMYVSSPNKRGNDVHEINTFHHQSVNRLGEGLQLLGWSKAYQNCPSTLGENSLIMECERVGKDEHFHSIVEAFESHADSDHNVLCFQYHPEEFNCEFARLQITKLLRSHSVQTGIKEAIIQASE